MADERIGDWMLTASGKQYWPLDPRPEDVCLTDIATHLSKECRYNGACVGFYSVAEHSVLVSLVVPPEHALQALLHDAPEAYVKDIPRPLKRGLGLAYGDIEEVNWLVICMALGIESEMHPCIKDADDAVLAAERQQIMPPDGPAWTLRAAPAHVVVQGLPWEQARSRFMARYYELAGGRSA